MGGAAMKKRKTESLWTQKTDDDWANELESLPIFICSQMQPGHVLTENDFNAIQALVLEIDNRENAEVEAFHQGRENALMEIGGIDLITSVKLKDDERIAQHVRRAMDRMFPKGQKAEH